MSNDAQQYDIAAIRKLLLAAFTPEELRRFCYDRPDFRPVVRRFGSKYNLEEMVDELITYCNTNLFFVELLTELKQAKSRQYAHFIQPDHPREEPVPPAPDLALSASDRDTITSPIHLELVCVPAGEFQMGSIVDRDKDARHDEQPPHTVYLGQFYIGKYPVTNVQYRTFVWATGHGAPSHSATGIIPKGKEDHPVVNVSWHEAVAFCDWLSRETGQPFRLPTEAEWEKAARGTDGCIYPWGDELPNRRRCNFWTGLGASLRLGAAVSFANPISGSHVSVVGRMITTIGRYSPQGNSPYGCADMAG